MYEQQGFEPPPGLLKPALRNQTALDTLLNHHMAQQDTQSGALSAAELIIAADELTELVSNVPKVDMLRHAHAVHQEDYLAAVDTLYKYFDYSTGKLSLLLLDLSLASFQPYKRCQCPQTDENFLPFA